MPKTRTKYNCQQCGAEQSKWMGKCPDCGAWNTLEEVAEIQLPQNSAQQRRSSSLAANLVLANPLCSYRPQAPSLKTWVPSFMSPAKNRSSRLRCALNA